MCQYDRNKACQYENVYFRQANVSRCVTFLKALCNYHCQVLYANNPRDQDEQPRKDACSSTTIAYQRANLRSTTNRVKHRRRLLATNVTKEQYFRPSKYFRLFLRVFCFPTYPTGSFSNEQCTTL